MKNKKVVVFCKCGAYDDEHLHSLKTGECSPKKQPTHTPTPWRVELERSPLRVEPTDQKFPPICNVLHQDTSEETNANAAFIVKACNNFDQMLSTLKLVIAEWPEKFTPCYEALKQAIAQAGVK